MSTRGEDPRRCRREPQRCLGHGELNDAVMDEREEEGLADISEVIAPPRHKALIEEPSNKELF